jgi:hypothetical protein
MLLDMAAQVNTRRTTGAGVRHWARGTRSRVSITTIGAMEPFHTARVPTSASAGLIHARKADMAGRIAEVQGFEAQPDGVRRTLEASPPPLACQADLTCCVPIGLTVPVPIELVTTR